MSLSRILTLAIVLTPIYSSCGWNTFENESYVKINWEGITDSWRFTLLVSTDSVAFKPILDEQDPSQVPLVISSLQYEILLNYITENRQAGSPILKQGEGGYKVSINTIDGAITSYYLVGRDSYECYFLKLSRVLKQDPASEWRELSPLDEHITGLFLSRHHPKTLELIHH